MFRLNSIFYKDENMRLSEYMCAEQDKENIPG